MPISKNAVSAALAPQTEEREVCLLTITHPSWDEPLRLSTDATELIGADEATGTPLYGTVSRGITFLYVPISATVPDSRDETPPTAKISIDNVSRYVAPWLMVAEDDHPKVAVEVCLASSPDVIDQSWPELDLTEATLDSARVEATLGMDMASNEPMPWLRFSEAYFPNLFER